ncbi:MAG TPA: glycosyltransferase family 39 protein [Casimicrobiaceae bacterium]|nr:glycosyltransferase family 39 protein [Casimicrobiaceae bacterium]
MTDVRTPVSRAFVIVLAAAILLQAALLVPAVLKALAATPPPDYDILDAVKVAAAGLAASAILFIGWRRHLRIATALVLIVVAAALLTPGVVLLVALMLANAYVVGRAVLRWITPGDADDRAVPWTAALLVGYSLWIGVMAATAGIKVHFLPVYVAALVLPLIHWRTELRVACVSLWQALSRPSRLGGTETAWLALLTAVVLVHLFVVAKPEVGYDATAVHLQFAQLLANRHRWDFDVTRYAWADMPLGADLSFAAAYILGGEAASRTLNFAFGVLACQLIYQLIRRYAQSEIALASVCLLASMPLTYLETGTLFVENLWAAFLLATLLVAIDYARTRSAVTLAACALLAAGAMQTKVIGVIWLVPIVAAVAILMLSGQRYRFVGWRCLAIMAGAFAIAAWPYANAWARTGNPVFPFMNDLFRSPYFDATSAFTNPMYETSLQWTSLHDLLLQSGRFIEGSNGATGWQWLLLLAVIAAAFLFRRLPRRDRRPRHRLLASSHIP